MTPSHSNRLRSRALRLLARRSHSRLQLRQKLLRSGTPETVDSLLDQLQERGLLDDAGFALERARQQRQRRLWGNHRIVQDLKRNGIDARIIEHVLSQIECETEQSASLQQAIEKWVIRHGRPGAASHLKRLFDHCFRLGYDSDLIRKTLQAHFGGIGWED